MPVTERQKAFYERNGYLIVEDLVNSDQLQAYCETVERMIAGRIECDDLRADLGGHLARVVPTVENITHIMLPSELAPWLVDSGFFRRSRGIARQLLGDDLDRDMDMMIDKAPGTDTATPWHQDQAYWMPGMPDLRSVTCWLALDETTVENGCMWFVPGLHRVPVRMHRYSGESGHALETEAWEAEAVACPLAPGSATFHDGGTLHYSRGNSTSARRRALITNFRPAAMIAWERARLRPPPRARRARRRVRARRSARGMIRPGVDAPLAVSVFDTPEDLGRDLAAAILAALALARRSFVLGCPSGRSLTSTYAALAAQAARERADLSQLVIAMMDEYVREEEGRFVPCPAGAHYSARRFAREEILSRLNRGLPRAKRVTEEHVWLPDQARPADFEARLGDAGGVDLFFLASGASDGHVAFNGPGSSRDSRCRVVDLSETTRRDNVASFPAFAAIEDVPRHGVTVGLGTIAERSKSVALVIHGVHKKAAARRLMARSGFIPEWPASIVYACQKSRLLLDRAAADGTVARKS